MSVTALLDYLNAAPTPYHAVAEARHQLEAAGFTALESGARWQLEPNGRYFFIRRGSSLVAFVVGSNGAGAGARVIGAHTDSPTLKVKPNPDLRILDYWLAGTEVYGGALFAPWFDRDLSLAGRVLLRRGASLEAQLVNIRRPVAIIPSLAIHLDRNVNAGLVINPQEQLRPLFGNLGGVDGIRELLLKEVADGHGLTAADILSFDLCFYDCQPASLLGVNADFVASARIDNLLSCHSALQALLDSANESCLHTRVIALFDHEEVGSGSDAGAAGNILLEWAERLAPEPDVRYTMLSRSCLLSADNAHGIHPNYPNKHDRDHAPRLNQGPVLKFDANQSYATSPAPAAAIKQLAHDLDVPLQEYVTRSDLRCGSTIGPMTSAKLGMPGIDIGCATFAMHSVRELAGARDAQLFPRLLAGFLSSREWVVPE